MRGRSHLLLRRGTHHRPVVNLRHRALIRQVIEDLPDGSKNRVGRSISVRRLQLVARQAHCWSATAVSRTRPADRRLRSIGREESGIVARSMGRYEAADADAELRRKLAFVRDALREEMEKDGSERCYPVSNYALADKLAETTAAFHLRSGGRQRTR